MQGLEPAREDALRFLWDAGIPLDNNLAERGIRMVKVKVKVSGCFRSLAGARAFASIRSYISTAAKDGVGVLDSLTSLFAGKPFLPPNASLNIRPISKNPPLQN